MPDGADNQTLTARVVNAIGAVAAADWDACAGADNPFVSHGFLSALEDSGAVSASAGWLPHHLLLEDAGGRLLAAAPMYLKGHSQGEYVFDYAWAHAYEQAGGRYYPKLLSAVPFTPAPGPRLMARPDADRVAIADLLAGAMVEIARQSGVGSLHVNFPEPWSLGSLRRAGFIQRQGLQFHWRNRGYETFDDFLAALTSRKRKAVRRERRAVTEAGVSVRALRGAQIGPAEWDAFNRFYLDTYDRKWGGPYLNRRFFELLSQRLGERVVLVMARRDDDGAPRYIAGALNLMGSDALFGRNWGCVESHAFLHFECCYYAAIEFAIAHGLGRVEAGTQGPHKAQRGYEPTPTYSAHWFDHAGFGRAVADFVEQERREVEAEMAYFAEHTPYRSTEND